MTMRTRDPLVCECGHTGFLKCAENDAPFSKMYEDYSLEGFNGGSISITGNSDRPENMLTALGVSCPKCGQQGKVRFA